MKPLSALSSDEARGLQGLLFDLDDTVLTHGALSEAAFGALFRLRESGLLLLCVTGRPITWGTVLARQWPIAGAVCETGALSARGRDGRVIVQDSLSSSARQHNRDRLLALTGQLQARFPDLAAAADAPERVSDFTYDIGEARRCPEEVIGAASQFAEERGARTSRSSVHLHVSFDAHDKASGTLLLLSELGYDVTKALQSFAYIGDSENDAPCFAAFRTTLAVSNLRGRHTVPPRFRTRLPQGQGFVEAAQQLVSARAG